MDTVKKNILSILCGVIALLAIIAVLWPINSYIYGPLAAGLKTREAQYTDLTNLLKKQRKYPVVTYSEADAKQAVLASFPGSDVIKAGQAAVEEVKRQSKDVRDAAVAVDKRRHAPLMDVRTADPFRFKREYLAALERLGSAKQLDAGIPPNADEVQRRTEERRKEHEEKNLVKDEKGKEQNREQVNADFQAIAERLDDQLKTEAATKHKMYMSRDAMTVNSALGPTADRATPTAESLWYAQVALWVDQDVAEAVKNLNQKSHNVAESTVKHLGQLEVASDSSMYVIPAAAPGAEPAAGSTDAAAPASDASGVPKDFTMSPTGRVCNPLYDVVKFTLVLDVDATRIPEVVRELQRDKFITVYQMDTSILDNAHERAESGFIFGQGAVARLTMKCEELFMREWTKPMMPPTVKAALKIPSDTPEPDKAKDKSE